MKLEKIKENYVNWLADQLKFNQWSGSVLQVENELVDAYGRKPFVLVEETADGYVVTDDGFLMYKYNPIGENEDLNEYLAGMVIDAGFDFDEEHGVIARKSSEENLPAVITGLIQLEIMVSFIA